MFNKNKPLSTACYSLCTLFFAVFLAFQSCSNPLSEPDGQIATFTINLGGSGRAVYPPTDPASIAELRYEVKFFQGGNLVKTFTAEGSSVIKGSIETGSYTVTLEIFLRADNSLFAEGENI